MILIDTSAWVEFLRDTGSPACNAVDELLGGDVATCAPIRMEVLAGARDEQHLELLRRLLSRTTTLPMEPTDYDGAALLYRTCRRAGATVRSLVDCLIASVAISNGVDILTIDSDFEPLASHGGVRLHIVT